MEELRAAQAVLLPAVMNTTLTETAALLGVGRATVARLQSKFRQSGKRTLSGGKPRNWGGRRNALLTWAEEEEFLTPWLEQASAGGLLVVSPLRAALKAEGQSLRQIAERLGIGYGTVRARLLFSHIKP